MLLGFSRSVLRVADIFSVVAQYRIVWSPTDAEAHQRNVCLIELESASSMPSHQTLAAGLRDLRRTNCLGGRFNFYSAHR